MRKPTFSQIGSAGSFLLNVVVTTVAATCRHGRRVLVYLIERLRLSRRTRAVERAGLVLGERLYEQRQGDGDLRRQIAVLDELSVVAATKASRSRTQRQKDDLLRRLAASTLRMTEPPPDVGKAYRDFRRALAAVREARDQIADARTALRPRNRCEWLHVGLGAAALASMLVGLVLSLTPSLSRPEILQPEVVGDKAGNGDEPQLAAVLPPASSAAPPAALAAVPPTTPPPAPAPVEAHADGLPDPTPTMGMTKSLDVDLKTDPRKNCRVHGPVEWEVGRLTLGPDGSVRRVLDCGAQAKMTLRLVFMPLKEDGQSSTTRFAFQIRDRGEFVVEIVRRREAGKTVGEVRLLDRDALPVKEKQPRLLRTSPRKSDFPVSPWIFRHHHGLVTVYCGSKPMVVGYADKDPQPNWLTRETSPAGNLAFFQKCGISEPLEVAGWSLEQQGMPVACVAMSGSASPSYREGLSPFWQNALADKRVEAYWCEAYNLRARLDHRMRQENSGNAHDSIQMEWEQWEQGEPVLRRDMMDIKLTNVVAMLGKKHHYYALAMAGIGMQFFWVGNKDKVAERLLKQAAEISEESLGIWHPDCVLVVSALARVYVKIGKLQLAEPLLKKVLKATATAFGSESFRYAAALRELAMLQQYNGRHAEAETTLRQSVDACKDATSPQRADALIALGELEAIMGEREKAAALMKRAEEVIAGEIQRLNLKPPREYMPLYVPLARARVLRAWILFHDGQNEQARQLIRPAFLNLVQFWNAPGYGALQGSGRFEGWDREILNAGPDGFMARDPAYGLVMLEVAELFIALGDVLPATGAVRVLDQVPGQTHHERGAIYRLMSNICAANPKVNIGIRRSFSERMRLDSAYMYGNKKAEFPDRVQYWQKLAQDEFEKFAGREHPDTLRMLQDQARRQWQMSEAKAAERTLRDAFNRAMLLSDRVLSGLPETQAYQFSEANPPPTDLLLSCYRATNQERGRDAYEVVWRAKALATRQFAERRQLLQAASGRPEVTKMVEELQTTRRQLAQLSLSNPPEAALERRQQELAKLTQRKEDLERELARLSESFRKSRSTARAGVADMVRRLPAKTAVVDFVERRQWVPPSKASERWDHTRCYDAFVLRPAEGEPDWSAAWVTLGDADTLDRSLEEWLGTLRSKRRPNRALAEQLRRRLWAPIEAAMGDCRTAILIPDGRLALVPWAALPGRRADSYLIEDYALAQVPYGQYAAHLLADLTPEGDGLLLVGGIDYGPRGKWSRLPGTADEVKQLEQLRPGPRTARLVGDSATKARLRELLSGRRYVHLATHGAFLDPGPGRDAVRFREADRASGGAVFDVTLRNPLLLSMLVLAGANRPAKSDGRGLPIGSDSFLTAEEVMGLDLTQTELVVLSACETGLGKVRGGEGVFSLQRAFHIGGSRTVMASLWQIPDKATQVLMVRFYENLWQKKMSKLEALRETQIWMLREGAKQRDLVRGVLPRLPEEIEETKDGSLPPFYWAAFALSGDWR